MKRLRDYPDSTALAEMYPEPHKHHVFPDHVERVRETIAFALPHVQEMIGEYGPPYKIADLSTGDAVIPKGFVTPFPQGDVLLYLGDMAPGYPLTGPIGETISELDLGIDLFVCCETLEHVDDPRETLQLIYNWTDAILLTTPIDNWDDTNPEHIWAWDAAGVSFLLADAGFRYKAYRELDLRHMGGYKWGMWLAI